MFTKIALAVGLFVTLTIVHSRGLEKAERTSLTELQGVKLQNVNLQGVKLQNVNLQGVTEASALDVFQSPSPDCDPVNDPSSCRY